MVERRILGPLPTDLSGKASLRRPYVFPQFCIESVSDSTREPRVGVRRGRPCICPCPKENAHQAGTLQGLHWPWPCCVQTRLLLSINLIKACSKQRHADWVGRVELPCLEYFLVPGLVLT